MSHFLVFQLYGAMAAWGDVAVGERRMTTMQPSQSAVFGLLAAALGITRDEEEQHQALVENYAFAVRVDAAGVLLRDYHTTQTIEKVGRLKHLQIRRDELADKHNIKTTLSSRDYRCDGFYTVCLWGKNNNLPFSFEKIQNALKKPFFTLYLGRKSCPLTLPVLAQVIEVETLEAALSSFDKNHAEKRAFLQENHVILAEKPAVYWDEFIPTHLSSLYSTSRADRLVSRQRLQFVKRTEHYGKYEGN